MSDRYWIDHCIGIARDAGNIDAAHDATNEIERLQAERDALLKALKAIVKSLADQDDEGLIEHSQQMIHARAALDAARGAT